MIVGINTRRGRRKGTPKTGGRQMGTPNKATVEVKAWAQSVLGDHRVRAKTLDLARAGRLQPGVLIELMYYASGRPVDRHEVTGADGVPFQRSIVVVEVPPRSNE